MNERTYTIVGTPHYMAPEMILGKGYDATIDLYALGVMLYEFEFGNMPWADGEEDPMTIYTEMLNGDLTYPTHANDRTEARPLIE